MTTTNLRLTHISFKKTLKSETFINTALTIAIFSIMLIIISSPNTFADGTVSGLKLFFFSVLPGLFPFMLLTKLLTELGTMFKLCEKLGKFSKKLFGTPGISMYAFFMSIISGYPIGAKIISDLYQKNLISEEDAKRMSLFCTTSGPIFVIGTVGAIMFKNYTFGIILYVSHIASSVLLGILYNLLHKRKSDYKETETLTTFAKNKNILGFCINETINSLFTVGAYITIFFLIAELLKILGIFSVLSAIILPIFKLFHLSPDLCDGFVYGILEVTRGAKVLSASPSAASLVLASGVLSFSGLSIIFQEMAFLKTAKIKTQTFVGFKFVHLVLSMLLCFVLAICFIK